MTCSQICLNLNSKNVIKRLDICPLNQRIFIVTPLFLALASVSKSLFQDSTVGLIVFLCSLFKIVYQKVSRVSIHTSANRKF